MTNSPELKEPYNLCHNVTPPVTSWFISPRNDSYKYHTPYSYWSLDHGIIFLICESVQFDDRLGMDIYFSRMDIGCHAESDSFTIWLFNSLPWKDPPFLSLVNPGKPSISMVHLYHVKLLVITRLGRFILIPMMVHWSPSQSTKNSNPYSTFLYFSEQL